MRALTLGLLFCLLVTTPVHAQEQAGAAVIPVIQSVELNTSAVANGGDVTVTVKVRSDVPVNWINCSLRGPDNDTIYGGGHGASFMRVGNSSWVYQWSDFISEWQPSGKYTYYGISVMNEGRLTSEIWPSVSFAVNNTLQADVPVIESVTLSTDTITGGGDIVVTVKARSDAPVSWINRSLRGPNDDTIYGGGHGATFTEVEDGLWMYQWVDTISEWQSSGTYTYYRISVMNEGRLTSEIWPGINFIVSNRDSWKFHSYLSLVVAK